MKSLSSVRLSVRLSVTKSSLDWIVGFFWFFYMMITNHDIEWLMKPNFWKKKWWRNLGPRGLDYAQNEFFCHFVFVSLVLLAIAYSDSLQQCLTSSGGKTHEKYFWAQIWAKWTKVRPEISFFWHFLKFGSQVFLETAYNGSLQQCLTSSRGETYKKNWGPKLGPKLGFSLFSQV